MSGGNCGNDKDGRPVGYAVQAGCDYPGCTAKIHRGLSYVCGGEHGGGEEGCGKYFCSAHLVVDDVKKHALCLRCFSVVAGERLNRDYRDHIPATLAAPEKSDPTPEVVDGQTAGILDLAAYKRRKQPVCPAAEIREESIAKARNFVSSLENGEAIGFLLIVQMKEGAPRFQAGGELTCADGLWLIEQLKKQLLND